MCVCACVCVCVCVCVCQAEKRNIFRDRGMHSVNSDEEEDGYDASHARRRGASVDEFLRGSELGQQVPRPVALSAEQGYALCHDSARFWI